MKILLVDDEPFILKGLASIINDEASMPTEIVTATDGLDALEKLDSFEPDLVITDIYMPEMNGFAFIEMLQHRGSCKRIVILTGYDDFSLVRKALNAQTMDYLLKPVNKEELLSILQKVSHEVQEDQNKRLQHELSKLREVMLYGVPHEEVMCTDDLIAELFPYPYAVVIVVQLMIENHEVSSKSGAAEALRCYTINYIFYSAFKNQVIAILNVPSMLVERELADLKASLKQIPDLSIQGEIGVYQERFSLLFLNDMYMNACKNLFGSKHTQPALDMYGQDEEERAARNLLYDFLDVMNPHPVKVPTPVPYSTSIQTILHYIETNYIHDISLEKIADVVHLHPNYISILFKKEIGETLIRYLHTFRLNKAKEIITNQPEIAFSKVGSMVGYENSVHFFKIFKKYTGGTPGQFRDLQQQ